MYKEVALPIRVPKGKYCWMMNKEPRTICENFSVGEGGYESCACNLFRAGDPERDKVGFLKPKKCLDLRDA